MRLMQIVVIGALLLVHMGASVAEVSSEAEEAVLSITPVENGSRIAVRLTITKGNAVEGLRWYNNDGSTAFRRISLIAVDGALPSEESASVTIIENESGLSSAWSEIRLDQPVSILGTPFAVFELSAGQEFTASGAGGGPALGYRLDGEASTVFFSLDGIEWTPLRASVRLLVEPLLVPEAAGTMALLSSRPSRSESSDIPGRTGLLTPYPNPGNPQIYIPFSLARESAILIRIYDLRGRLVRTLATGRSGSGRHARIWDGRDDYGRSVSSGMYFTRLQVDDQSFTKRVVLVR